MLADEIAAALPGLRAEAEARMVDSCTITSGSTPGAWNDTTGVFDPPTKVIVYSGKCRVRNAFGAPQATDAGETMWGVDQCVVSVPVEGSAAVTDGHEVEITACVNDPGMVVQTFTVMAGHFQTDSTARRLPCQVVTRDA